MDLRNKLGLAAPANCSFLYEPPNTPGSIFRGLFQQDNLHFAGSHNGMGSGGQRETEAPSLH